MELNENLERYILEHSKEEDELLSELNRKTHLDVLQPRMLSGHLQGLLLEFISKMIAPEKILEIGTFTGYSAMCLAKGLKPGGELITIEKNDELQSIIESYINKSEYKNCIKLRIGKALPIIESINETFDLVFIDADKEEYSAYFDAVIDKLRSGGYILADNVLWSGKVIDITQINDPSTKAILEFNKKIKDDPRVENIILPIRDGISLIRKL